MSRTNISISKVVQKDVHFLVVDGEVPIPEPYRGVKGLLAIEKRLA